MARNCLRNGRGRTPRALAPKGSASALREEGTGFYLLWPVAAVGVVGPDRACA